MNALLIDVEREVLRPVALPLHLTTHDADGVGEWLPWRVRHSRYDGGHFILSSSAATSSTAKRAYCPGSWWQGYAGQLLVCGVGRGRSLIDLTPAELQHYRRHLIFQPGPPSEWSRPRRRPARLSAQLNIPF